MLCEINPLIVTPAGEVRALDSKFTVDDNALYRHADIAEMRDTAAADPLEALAREKHVTYVKLDGERRSARERCRADDVDAWTSSPSRAAGRRTSAISVAVVTPRVSSMRSP